MKFTSKKKVSKKRIALKIVLTALVVVVLCQPAYVMENDHRPLDYAWTWNGAPKLMDVIGMSDRKINKYEEHLERIGVAVLDEYINPLACDVSQLCIEKAPVNYDFDENDHGTHVANTIREISPSTLIWVLEKYIAL